MFNDFPKMMLFMR